MICPSPKVMVKTPAALLEPKRRAWFAAPKILVEEAEEMVTEGSPEVRADKAFASLSSVESLVIGLAIEIVTSCVTAEESVTWML